MHWWIQPGGWAWGETMIDNIWFCGPNDARESWCFFTMKLKEIDGHQCVTGWEVTYANPARVTYKTKNTPSAEEILLRQILFHISTCKKKRALFITYERKIIPILRSRLLCHGMCNINLGNLKILSVQQLLEDFFYFVRPFDNRHGVWAAEVFGGADGD
jgi:hypothetical protein